MKLVFSKSRTLFPGLISIVLLILMVGYQNMTPFISSRTGLPIEKCGAAPKTLALNSVPLINKFQIAENWGKTGDVPFSCPPVPAIPAYNPPSSVLSDKITVDPAYAVHMKPWNDYFIQVNSLGDLYLESRMPEVASCVMTWLNAWSSTRVLSRNIDYPRYYTAYSTNQGEYDRIAVPGILITNFLKLKGETLDPNQVANFKAWMESILIPMRAFIVNRESKNVIDRNNHSYWAGLSSLIYADAFENMSSPSALWGIARFDMGIQSIQADGTLPNELMRNEKAAVYHQYAMMPLVMMAEIGVRNGIPMYSRNSNSIRRLKDLIVDYYNNPAIMENLTRGYVQSTSPGLYFLQDTIYLSWMEIWYTRFGDRDLKPLIAKARYWGRLNNKTSNRRQGGDLTQMFGVSDCHLPMASVDKDEFITIDAYCRGSGSCTSETVCPQGYVVHAARSSCGFTNNTIKTNTVYTNWKDLVVLNRLNVQSDSQVSGSCSLNGTSVTYGTQPVSVPFNSSVNFSCNVASTNRCSLRAEVVCGKVN